MSSPNVRNAFRALMTGGTWPASLPYSETFNQYVDPGTIRGKWSAVEFTVTDTERICIGQPEFREDGTVMIKALTERGMSFADIESAFDAIRPTVLGHIWPSGISILDVGALEVISPGGEGLHVEAAIPVSYSYFHTGGL